MALKVAINGFGRIGRHIFRQIIKDPSFEVVAINDITDAPTLAHLLAYDSAYGRFENQVTVSENAIEVAGKEVKVLCKSSIDGNVWGELGADFVFESTGKYAKGDKIRIHNENGAKWTMITAPAKGVDMMVVYGVNHQKLDKEKHKVISNASCTTNCLAPVVKVIHENFGLVHGLLTTVHAVTNDQRLLDLPHSDLRRARAAIASMIPTTTGAAKAIGEVMPELKGKLDGVSVRVPTITVSLVDLTFTTEKPISKDALNEAFHRAKEGSLKGILDITELPLVSIDFLKDSHSAIVDGLSTMTMGEKLGKVFAWYDNEWGYATRCVDVAKLFL
ncbi:MAG: type I glyceraldehyde-3-phosphate dehydrogenase [Acidobacteriota bacterium]